MTSFELRAQGLIAEADIDDHIRGRCQTAQLVLVACRTYYLWIDEGASEKAVNYQRKIEKHLGFPLPIKPELSRTEWDEHMQQWRASCCFDQA